MLPANLTFAGTWRDDFEDNKTNEWEIFNLVRQHEKWRVSDGVAVRQHEKWRVSDGVAIGEIFEDPFLSLWRTGEQDWEFYTLSCRMKLDDDKTLPPRIGLTLHDRGDEGSRYLFLINFDTNIASISKEIPGGGIVLSPVEVEKGIWYDISGTVFEDGSLEFLINGEIVISAFDRSPLDGGLAGLVVQNAQASFDNVQISGDNIPNGGPTKSFDVAPQEKLTTTWNANTGTHIRTLTGHTDWVRSVSFSPDGNTIASASYDNTIRLWNPNTGKHIRTLTGHTGSVESVSFSPDGNTIASASWDHTIRLWNANTGRHIRTLTGHTGSVESVAFSPDGSTIASGSLDDTIHLWNAKTGTHIRTLTGHTGSVWSVSFSPDGNTIASASWDHTIRLWNANTGRHIRTLTGHTSLVLSVSFSSDGNTIASGSSDETIRLWNAHTGTHIRTLTGHTGWVRSVSFSPDGNTIASGSRQEIRLWNANTGRHIRTLTGHTNYVYSVSFSPDGNTIASGSWDGTVLLWELNPTPISDTAVSLSPTSIASPDVGEQLSFSLNIADGQNIAGYQATVQFDSTALRYVQSENGTYLPSGAFFIPPQVEGDTVQLAASSLAGETMGDGILATITFEVVAVKESTVRLSDVILTNSTGETTNPQTENAEITEPSQLPEDVNGDGVVNIVDLTLVATNFGATGTNAADVNGDGVVNIVDLTLVAAAFGNTAAAPFLWSRDSEIAPTRADVEAWMREARKMNLTDPEFLRGIAVLEQLLKALTPKETALLPNYPNPFNPETWIPYQLATPSDVSISIYASDGKLIRTLDLGHQPVGKYHHRNQAAYWDGKNEQGEPVANGVYFYTFSAGDFTATRKMLIRK